MTLLASDRPICIEKVDAAIRELESTNLDEIKLFIRIPAFIFRDCHMIQNFIVTPFHIVNQILYLSIQKWVS
jgi:hypothetical protein